MGFGRHTIVHRERVSPRRYLKLADEQKGNISKVVFLPAELGRKHFGRLEVVYKRPLVRAVHAS